MIGIAKRARPEPSGAARASRPVFRVVALLLGLTALVGCTATRTAPPPAPPVVRLPTPSGNLAPTTEVTLLIESAPAGATIVVDGRPVGKAPVRVAVPATPQGFFRDDIEIRTRFIADDPAETSRTATEELLPREKVPAALVFTLDGAQRRWER